MYIQKMIYSVLIIVPLFSQLGWSSDCSYDYFKTFTMAYEQRGNQKYMIQEEITQSAHVLQAAHIAQLAGAPEDIIIGLLMHDVGQVIIAEHAGDAEFLHAKHDDFGAQWLKENGFPQDVIDLVQYHTLSKIILCANESDYYHNLSEASKISLEIQKKKFSQPENAVKVNYLKQHSRLQDYLAARKCDEMAKISDPRLDKVIPDFNHYCEMTERVREGKGALASAPNWREKIKSLHQAMKEDRQGFEKQLIEASSN